MPGVTLVLGPLLRYAGTESATFWVETGAPCEVEILGRREPTFTVEGHHYALLLVDDLEPASVTPYEVRLDGELVWPPADGRPQPVVHTRNDEPRVRLIFGSCRVGGPQPTEVAPPWPEDLARTGVDGVWGYARAPPRGEGRVARRPAPARRPGVRGRGLARDARVHREQARHEQAAGLPGRGLRGVHAPLSRVLVGPGHPLAARNRPQRDDLRRPRRPRRLE